MLSELILSGLLMLMSSSAAEVDLICDEIADAFHGSINSVKSQCAYDLTADSLTITGSSPTPHATLGQLPSVANVRTLHIKSMLTGIAVEAFDHLNGTLHVTLESNALKQMPAKTLSKLASLRTLHLVDNHQLDTMVPFADLPRSLVYAIISRNRVKRLAGLKDIPTSMRTLFFTSALLTSFVMEPSFLGDPSYHLSRLSLQDNRIREYHTPELSKLEWLNLRNNLLRQVSSDAFEGLRALRHLLLAGNRIETIEEGAFDHTPALNELFLDDNLLRTLSEDISLPNLSRLSIGGNRLQFLRLKLFAGSKLRRVNLHGNPFSCGCLDDLLKWIDIYQVEISCRRHSLNGLAPDCVVHSSNIHYCSYQYYEDDVDYFMKNRYTNSLNNSLKCY